MAQERVEWRGLGRWLSFAVAALMIILVVPSFATNDVGAGLNIFLGLLLFGAVVSGNRHAPLLVGVLVALMVARVSVALVIERSMAAGLTHAALLVPLVVAWLDLRRQARLHGEPRPEQAS